MLAQVEEAIVTGTFKPGDKLPPEREMQQVFDCSRGPVREALKTLEQKGLLTIKNGPRGGAVVRSLGTRQLRDSLGLLIRNKKVPPSRLAEFREAVEGAAGGLAAQRISQTEQKKLKDMFREMALLAKGGDAPDFWAMERKMHCELAKASGNLMFEWVLTSIHQELPSYGDLYPSAQKGIAESLDHWKNLLKAIDQGDIMLAASLSRLHVRLSHMQHHLTKDDSREGLKNS
ncbi:GntR family transcriptional regulator [Dethiosulfatarculus sandiegensis]|uniref:GntR family transcriptional regulator n=1 Tax=Dethiosulfatarculus sandiegensis TaxID=1429043 RepID=A0A0D2GCR8_9BACT|nr:GntR family transcriptional regulator [Dethiosulfatarculus sandiegensis]